MKRRTDRAIAISAVTAVAVVPTAIVMIVQVGGGSAGDGGSAPASAAMADQNPANPNGTATGIVTPGAPAAPGPGSGAAGPGAASGAPGTPAGGAFGDLPTAPPQPGPSLHSFTRKTDVKVTVGANGDYKHATETASFTLWPTFAMNATGVTQTMKGGELSKITQKVVVSGRTLRGFDGEEWTRSTLTAAQLDALQTQSDPRQFTFMIGTLPGTTASEPDEAGKTHFTAQARMGSVFSLLPRDAAAAIRASVPEDTGCGLDLWADSKSRPTWIGLNAQAPGATFTGSMTFASYR